MFLVYLGTDTCNTKMAPKIKRKTNLRKFILDWIEVYCYLSAPWKIKKQGIQGVPE